MKKLRQDLDLTAMIKRMRAIDVLSQMKLSPSQIQLMQYLKINLVNPNA